MAINNLTDLKNKFLERAETLLKGADIENADEKKMVFLAALIRGYDSTNKFDVISTDALAMLSKMTAAELQAYLQDESNRHSFMQVANSQSAMKVVASSAAAMATVAGSVTAMEVICSSTIALDELIARPSAWAAIVASNIAMGVICRIDAAIKRFSNAAPVWTAITSSEALMAIVVADPVAIRVVVEGGYGVWITVQSPVALDAIMKKSDVWNIAVQSQTFMTHVAMSQAAFARVAAYQAAMIAVVQSNVALGAIVNQKVALAEIRKSNIAINVINASQAALDALYAKATKFNFAYSGAYSANPETLVTGNYLLVRITTIDNKTGWTEGTVAGNCYVKIGGALFATTTWGGNGVSNIKAYKNPFVQDNALRPVNNTTITFLAINSTEIAYLEA